MTQGPGGATAQQTIEVRISRFVSDGLHEDVDVTNFTQQAANLTLDLMLDADFADAAETRGERLQRGKVERTWNTNEREHTICFSYQAEYAYSHQGNVGTAQLQRAVTIRFQNPGTPSTRRKDGVRYAFVLEPRATWHLCVDVVPFIDGAELPSQYRCRSFAPGTGPYDSRRQAFLQDASTVSTPATATLVPVVVATLEQGKRDQ